MHHADHLVETSDGRRLHVIERGAEGGLAVIGHHGTPGSGQIRPHHAELALERGARMIAFDRPGYGRSDADPGRAVADVAADVAAIADALGAERFVTWGASGGGPHALACGALLSDRCAAVATVAGVAPYGGEGLDFLAGMGEENLEEFGRALEGRVMLEPYLRELAPEILAGDVEENVALMETLLSPPDRTVFTGELGELIIRGFKDGLAPGPEGWVEDDLAFTVDWGFSLDAIRVPVLLLQGEQDLMVPAAHGRWLAEHLPGVDARILPDDGHLTLTVTRMPEILDWLLDKL